MDRAREIAPAPEPPPARTTNAFNSPTAATASASRESKTAEVVYLTVRAQAGPNAREANVKPIVEMGSVNRELKTVVPAPRIVRALGEQVVRTNNVFLGPPAETAPVRQVSKTVEPAPRTVLVQEGRAAKINSVFQVLSVGTASAHPGLRIVAPVPRTVRVLGEQVVRISNASPIPTEQIFPKRH